MTKKKQKKKNKEREEGKYDKGKVEEKRQENRRSRRWKRRDGRKQGEDKERTRKSPAESQDDLRSLKLGNVGNKSRMCHYPADMFGLTKSLRLIIQDI